MTGSLYLALSLFFAGVCKISEGLVGQVRARARSLNDGRLSGSTIEVGDGVALRAHMFAAAMEIRDSIVRESRISPPSPWDDVVVGPEACPARKDPSLVPRYWIRERFGDPDSAQRVCGVVSWREHRQSFGNDHRHKENAKNSLRKRARRFCRRTHPRNTMLAA